MPFFFLKIRRVVSNLKQVQLMTFFEVTQFWSAKISKMTLKKRALQRDLLRHPVFQIC